MQLMVIKMPLMIKMQLMMQLMIQQSFPLLLKNLYLQDDDSRFLVLIWLNLLRVLYQNL